MSKILDEIALSYVDCQTLLAHLMDYRNPRDWISRMVKKGELIRLRNGFFLIASRFKSGKADFPFEQIANLLYGPSYISLEWALSFYGFIPERVSEITSVTTGNHKEFLTQIGLFSYRHLSKARYAVGIEHREIQGHLGGFLIATPEKALIDWVYFSTENMSEEELLIDLTENKRVEIDKLKSLNIDLLSKIANQYRSEIIRKFVKAIKLL